MQSGLRFSHVARAFICLCLAAGVLAAAALAGAPADVNPPVVTAPTSSNDAASAWAKAAACLSKKLGRRVTVGAPPNYGVQIAGPAHPYASEAERLAFRARLERAMAACGRYLRPIQGDVNSSEFEAKFRYAMLAAAR